LVRHGDAVDIVDGQLRSKPIVADTDQGRASAPPTSTCGPSPSTASGAWSASAPTTGLTRRRALPAAIVQYRGPVTALSALETRIGTEALERELTARMMELDLEELERLRQADEARRRSELERSACSRRTHGRRPDRPRPNTPMLPKGNSVPATPG
jgi:hypothetical protein